MRDLAPEDWAYINTLAPPPSVVTGIVALVFYINEEGEQTFSKHIDCDIPIATIVGTLAGLLFDLLTEAREEEED